MTGHDIHKKFRYLNPRQVIKFQSYYSVLVTYLETGTDNQDKLNYQ